MAYASHIASTANITSAYAIGGLNTSAESKAHIKHDLRLTPTELHAYTMEHMELFERALDLLTPHAKELKMIAPLAHVMASLCILRQHTSAPQEDVESFIRSVMLGTNLEIDAPAHRARERLIGIRLSAQRATFIHTKAATRPAVTLEVIFRAWNAHRRERKLEKAIVIKGVLPALQS